MARVKLKTLREMNDTDLSDKLSDLKADLAKLRSEGAKGTLKKTNRRYTVGAQGHRSYNDAAK
jgi:ribosomal protein L29